MVARVLRAGIDRLRLRATSSKNPVPHAPKVPVRPAKEQPAEAGATVEIK